MNQTLLKEYLHYEPITGKFTWIKQSGRIIAGTSAGYSHKQRGEYICIGFKGKNYKAHRLAFLYMTGDIPDYVDHIDGNPINNKWENLRKATMTINNKNTSIQTNNTSGVTGVSYNVKRNFWVAQIGYKGKTIPLGRFKNKQDAIDVRVAAEKLYKYSKDHGRRKKPKNLQYEREDYQLTSVTKPALIRYLTGESLKDLMKEFKVSKRLLGWMEKLAKDTGAIREFKKIQKENKHQASKKLGRGISKEVCQYTLEGTYITKYASMIDAANTTGLNQGNISNVCTGRQKTTGGFKWALL